MIYLHDGTFDGLLTCIYEYYYTEKVTEIYDRSVYQPKLFDETKFVETHKEHAKKVYNSIMNKFSHEFYWQVFNAFHSNNYYKDCYILKFMVMAYKRGKDIDRIFSHVDALNVKRLSCKVGKEKHRFLGIVRFMDTGQFLFSKIAPDNDILILMGEHFSDRFKDEKLIIYDEKRHKGLISDKGQWYLSDMTIKADLPVSEKEKNFQNLWKQYFDTIGIEGRKNLKLQQAFVPLKYRGNIVEFGS